MKIYCYIAIKAHNILQKYLLGIYTQHKGCCYDNSVAESFFSSLKREILFDTLQHSAQQTRTAIFEYIEFFYNKQHIHSTINYCIPEQFILFVKKHSKLSLHFFWVRSVLAYSNLLKNSEKCCIITIV
ncbi:transposase [Wolbachia endosymbiont of Atemnus politus]|nr:transposase [Wolbachia endosymbiont of Atemnus politus]